MKDIESQVPLLPPDINRKTASKYLKELEEKNYLSHLQTGKEILYINNELMKVLKR